MILLPYKDRYTTESWAGHHDQNRLESAWGRYGSNRGNHPLCSTLSMVTG